MLKIEKTMEKSEDDELINLFEKNLDLSTDFPFLNDIATINFVRCSKVNQVVENLRIFAKV